MKETVRAIEGIGIYPVISLVIFVLFFISATLWAVLMRKTDVQHLADLPLDDGDTPTPIKGADRHG